MIDEDVFEQEIQKKKRRVFILLVCLFVLAGGGFIARRDLLVEETIEGRTTTPAPVANVTSQPTPVETPTPQEVGPEASEVRDTPTSTPTVEEATQTQAVEDIATATVADGVGGPTGTNQETPVNNVTDEADTEDSGGAISDDQPAAGDIDMGSDDEDDGEPQAGGEIGADRDSGDEVTSDDAGPGVGEEPTTDSGGTLDSDAGVDDRGVESEVSEQTNAGVSPADEIADEAQLESEVEDSSTSGESDTEDQTVEQDSDQRQETDFEPPPGQLPVTGITIINWAVAPIAAISVAILLALVSAGVSSLFSSKRRRH